MCSLGGCVGRLVLAQPPLAQPVRAHLQHCLSCRLLLLEARHAGAAPSPKPTRHS